MIVQMFLVALWLYGFLTCIVLSISVRGRIEMPAARLVGT